MARAWLVSAALVVATAVPGHAGAAGPTNTFIATGPEAIGEVLHFLREGRLSPRQDGAPAQ